MSLCPGRPQRRRLCPPAAGWCPARLQGCLADSAQPGLRQPQVPCFCLEAGCGGRGAKRCGAVARGAVSEAPAQRRAQQPGLSVAASIGRR